MALAWLPAMPSAHAEFGVAGSALAAMQYLDRFDRTACVSREKYNPPTPVGLPASPTFRQSDMARAARAKNQGCSTLTPLSALGVRKIRDGPTRPFCFADFPFGPSVDLDNR
jgi:hypothetical protein